jgi:hypothetical protein
MGKKRLEGQHCKIVVKSGETEIAIGEVNKLSVKTNNELRKSRSIGDSEQSSSLTFEGYELSFEGGKVDWKAAALLHRQDEEIVLGNRTPYFKVIQTLKYFGDNILQTITYPEVTIYGYEIEVDAGAEIQEKFSGFCGAKKVVKNTGKAETEEAIVTGYIDAMIITALASDANSDTYKPFPAGG